MSQESVVASLHELRAIEQQRIADEAAARNAQEAARAEARRAEAARIEAEAAAVRDAALAEAARLEAEVVAQRRAEELAIACAEATARARAEAELDAARMVEEMRVRREEVARTRPIGLLAVIAALVLGGAALVVVLVHQRADLDERNAAIDDVSAHAAKLRQDTDDLTHVAHTLEGEVAKSQAQLEAQKARVAELQAAAAAVTAGKQAPGPVVHRPPPPVQAVVVPRPPVVLDPHCADSVLGCMDRK